MNQLEPLDARALIEDIRRLIDETRSAVATTVNVGLTMLYWHIGERINQDLLHSGRADYGNPSFKLVSF